MTSIFFFIVLLLSIVTDTLGFFLSNSKSVTIPPYSKDCCLPPKVNVDSNKANLGSHFFRQLTIHSDLTPEVNIENICNLMHFLFQQASMNNKPVTVTEGLFILYDSSNQVFNRLIQAPKTTDIKYPTYGIDIPASCLPGGFDHILLGELPPVINDNKYSGTRMFIKAGRFGFEKMNMVSVINSMKPFIKQFVKQELCRLLRSETKPECAKRRALKENTDKVLFKRWKAVLKNLPSKWNINNRYRDRAYIYGIREIDQQSRDLEAAGARKHVKEVRVYLVKHYGQDDIRVRKGREIIFTSTALKQTHTTCEASKNMKQCKL